MRAPPPATAAGQMRRAARLEGRADRGAERFDGAPVVEAGKHERRGALRNRQHLEGDLGQESERAPGAGHQLHEVEPGDVLHHPPAGFYRLAAAVDEAHADEAVPRRAGHDPAWTGDVRRHHRADGRLAGRAEEDAVIGRLEGQLLALVGERAHHLRHRRAGPRRDHELGRLIERDPGERR